MSGVFEESKSVISEVESILSSAGSTERIEDPSCQSWGDNFPSINDGVGLCGSARVSKFCVRSGLPCSREEQPSSENSRLEGNKICWASAAGSGGAGLMGSGGVMVNVLNAGDGRSRSSTNPGRTVGVADLLAWICVRGVNV